MPLKRSTLDLSPLSAGAATGAELFGSAGGAAGLVEAAGLDAAGSVFSLVLQLVFGVWLALVLFHAKRLAGIVRSMFISPFMMPPVVAGMMWLVILDPSLGAANYLLQSLGLPSDAALLGAALVQVLADARTGAPVP